MDFPYPENTPGSDFKNNGGKYLRNLSDVNRAFLVEIQEWVAAENINVYDICLDVLDNDLIFLRFLRANNFNVKKTKKHILANIEWRKAQNIPELMAQTPEEILGCELSQMIQHFPHWHSGYDKTGRPLLFKQQGAFDTKEIKELAGGSFDRVIRYHIWEQELSSRLCYEASLRTKTIIETVTVVLDVKGMTLMSLNSDFRSMMSRIVEMDQEMYPETLGKILVCNASFIFPAIFSVVKPWLDPMTAAKINVKGSDFKDFLDENVGLDNLPSNYHGVLPALTKDVHPYVEGMQVLARPRTRLADVMQTVASDEKLAAEVGKLTVDVTIDPHNEKGATVFAFSTKEVAMDGPPKTPTTVAVSPC